MMKNKKLLTTMAAFAAVCLSGAALASCEFLTSSGTGHEHNLVKVEGMKETCTTPGQEAYYACLDCGLIYEDEAATKELEAPVTIAATGHTLGSEATCTEDQICSECEETIVAATGHTLTKVEAKSNSCSENGNVEHWECGVCDTLFSDAEGKTATTLDEVTVPAMHTYESELSYDGDSHYYACENCDSVKDDTPHEPTAHSDHINHWEACECGYETAREAHTTSAITAELIGSGFVEGGSITAANVTVTGECSCGKTFITSDVTVEDHVLVAGKNEIKIWYNGVSTTVTVEVTSMTEKLVHFAPSKQDGGYFEGVAGTNNGTATMNTKMVTLENGLPATTYTFNENTKVNDSITTWCNASGAGGRNSRLPVNANDPRTVILHATNNGDEEVTFRFGYVDYAVEYGGVDVTLAAGETKVVTFTIEKPSSTIGNNFHFILKSTVSKETSVTLHGYFYSNSDIDTISVSKNPAKTTFKVGEVFTAKGLILKPSASNYDDVYVYTNYRTSYEEGYVFTEDDIGTKQVTVSFAGKTCTYDITVEAAEQHDLVKKEGKSANCTEAGYKEYWTCNDCDKLFANAAGTVEIEEPEEIKALGHTPGAATTCTTAQTCTVCNEVLEAAKGHSYKSELVVETSKTVYEIGSSIDRANLIVKLACANCDYTESVTDYTLSKENDLQAEDTEIVISYVKDDVTYTATISISVAHNHTMVATNAKEATCSEAGNNAYWTCSACGKVYKDADGNEETSVEAETIPTIGHTPITKYDDEGHWEACEKCDYAGEKSAHVGVPYLDEGATCEVCGHKFADASTDGWVLYRPSTNVSAGATASRVTLNNGVWATNYVIGAGTTNVNLMHEDRAAYEAGKYQVRVPTVNGKPTYVMLYVTNNGENPVSFTFQRHSNADDSVAVSLAGKESNVFKFQVTAGDIIGDWYQIVMSEALAYDADVTIYGYFYVNNFGIKNLNVANEADIKHSYEVGEKFDLSNLILSANVLNSKGEALADLAAETYYVANNYKVEGFENGYVFTEEDAGNHTIVVSFAGESVEITINVKAHDHQAKLVERVEATCDKDGNEAYYVCEVDGCNEMFADEACTLPLTEVPVIAAGHVMSEALPGQKATCTRCGEAMGEVRSEENWVLFRPEINVGEGSLAGWAAEYGDVDGVYGSKFTFGAGVNADDRLKLTMWNEQGNFQTIIPNVVNGDVATRNVIMYYHNYGTEEITLKYENDNDGAYDLVTIPAGGVVVSTFENTRTGGGSNWFWLQVKNDITTDVTVGVYGYFYLDSEVSGISVVTAASKLNFKEGETFSAEGLMLKTSGSVKTTFVESGYTTDLDGYVFTAEDVKAGSKTVTVTFAGVTTTYNVLVSAHDHKIELVEEVAPVKCEKDGVEAYYACTVEGCEEIFADANGNVKLEAPVAIPCHTAGATLPGTAYVCVDCKETFGVRSQENWVFYNVTTNVINHGVVNGKVEAADVEGVSGTKLYIGAGTAGGTGNNFQLCMGDNDAGKQTVIPNIGSNEGIEGVRNVVLFYKNYSAIDVTLNMQNDASGGNGKITIPANGTAICEFAITNVNGSNWFNLFIDSDVTEDVVIGVYGYIYVNEKEVTTLSINMAATTTTFKVGETFSAAGLVLNAPIPSSNTKTLYVQSGYTTDLDGYVFTADDIGTKTVTVTFAGVTVTYEITVTA